jgi:hypothetical protein
MKKTITLLLLCSFVKFVAAGTGIRRDTTTVRGKKDTLSLRCILSCPGLFYGVELNEKPVRDIVDTLVGEIPHYDTGKVLKVVIVSGKDLGFTNETGISWKTIVDSAQGRGYELCPAQLGAELFILSQNMPSGKTLLHNHVLKGKPLFIGMEPLKHHVIENLDDFGVPLMAIFKRKDYFNYVFCIKSGTQLNSYDLGYSITESARDKKNYLWTSTDMFIFVNK